MIAASVEIRLVDGFEVRGGPAVITRPAQRLLAYLALHEIRQARNHVAYTLWPDSSESRAAASLRTALWSLRSSPFELVSVNAAWLGLAPGVVVDFRAVGEATRSLVAGADTERPVRIATLAGDLLPDWYEDWLIGPRERWKELRLQALEVLARECIARRYFLGAMEAALTAASNRASPRDDSAHPGAGAPRRGQPSPRTARVPLLQPVPLEELGVGPSPDLRNLVASAGLPAQSHAKRL
jgi:DNA-binding SARP family transcriptional activator